MSNETTPPKFMRYHRQVFIPSFGYDGQVSLENASVLVVGAGGLGCSALPYLVGSGIGRVVTIDDDVVEESNLHRQILHTESTVGLPKVESAKATLSKMNSEVTLEFYAERFSEARHQSLFQSVDVVLDCTDNLTTRNTINELSQRFKLPVVSGAAIRMEGQVTVFDPRHEDSPCYSCLSQFFGEQSLSCVESGILPPVVGVIGSIMALETIKIISNMGEPLIGKLLLFDAMESRWQRFSLEPSPTCKQCRSAEQR